MRKRAVLLVHLAEVLHVRAGRLATSGRPGEELRLNVNPSRDRHDLFSRKRNLGVLVFCATGAIALVGCKRDVDKEHMDAVGSKA